MGWNTNATKFLLPLPMVEEAESCGGLWEALLEHTLHNKEENRRAVFDHCGDCSLVQLRVAHEKLKKWEDAGFVHGSFCLDRCKILNLIEFVPQDYLKWFASDVQFYLSMESEFLELAKRRNKAVYSKQRMEQ